MSRQPRHPQPQTPETGRPETIHVTDEPILPEELITNAHMDNNDQVPLEPTYGDIFVANNNSNAASQGADQQPIRRVSMARPSVEQPSKVRQLLSGVSSALFGERPSLDIIRQMQDGKKDRIKKKLPKTPAVSRLEDRFTKMLNSPEQQELGVRYDAALDRLIKLLEPQSGKENVHGKKLEVRDEPHRYSVSVPPYIVAELQSGNVADAGVIAVSASYIQSKYEFDLGQPRRWISIDIFGGHKANDGSLDNRLWLPEYSMSWSDPVMREKSESEVSRIESLVGLLDGTDRNYLNEIINDLQYPNRPSMDVAASNVAASGIGAALMGMAEQQQRTNELLGQANALLEKLGKRNS